MDVGLLVNPSAVGLNIKQWEQTAREADRLGFYSLLVGDHFFAAAPQDSLEPFLLLTLAAQITRDCRIGTLVSPLTYRNPWELARWAANLHDLSIGRFTLGVGAGWYEAEHTAFGVPFPTIGERFDRLEEAIQVFKVLWSDQPASFQGNHFSVKQAQILPTPQGNGPAVLVGGNGGKRAIPAAARFADEWNATNLTPDILRKKVGLLNDFAAAHNRSAESIRVSMMVNAVVGRTTEELEQVTRVLMNAYGEKNATPIEFRKTASANDFIVGQAPEIIDRLSLLQEAGLDEVIFYSTGIDDAKLHFLAEEVNEKVK